MENISEQTSRQNALLHAQVSHVQA